MVAADAERRIVVVGAGAVGGAIGGLLHASGANVLLVARGEHGRELERHGLRLALPEGTDTLRVPATTSVADATLGSGDVVLLATKLYDAALALDEVLDAAGARIPVCLAVNGVAAETWAADRFDVVATTMVWLPATFLIPGEVALHSTDACRGVLDTGPVTPDAEPFASWMCTQFLRAGFDAVPRADIARWKRTKWLTNLGASQCADEGFDARDADARHALALEARAEGSRTLAAADLDHVPLSEFLARVAHVESAPIGGRARAGNSTWQSRERGRPLETRWLEGAIAELARENGVASPVNEALANASRRQLP